MDKPLADENWDFYTGNHFPYWNGPELPEDHNKRIKVQKQLERIFHPHNVCGRIVSHYVNALVGKPFTWNVKSKSDNTEILTSELRPLTSSSPTHPQVMQLIDSWLIWQNKSHIKKGENRGSAIASAITQMLVRDCGDGSGLGYLRLYRPKRFRNLANPYQRIVLHSPAPGSIIAKRDEDGILYQAEYHYGQGKKEVYELLDSGLTRITNAEGSVNDVDYNGALPVFELKERCIITSDLKRIQQAINKNLTLKDKNLEYAGFLERVIESGQPPGQWVKKTDENGHQQDVFVADTSLMELGPDRVAFVAPLPIGDPKAPTGYTNVNVKYRDPVPVTNFKESHEMDKADAYEVAGLGHLLTVGDGRMSGKSRISIKEDYVSDLGNYERVVEDILEEVVSLLLLILSREPEYQDLNLTDYEPVVDLNLSISPLPEEREQNRSDVQAGILSKESAISAGGRDADKEKELIRKEQQEELESLASKDNSFDSTNL